MRKVFLATFLFASSLMVLRQSYAAVGAPRDFRGDALKTIDFVGAIPCDIDASTATRPIQCGQDGRNIVYGVIVSSVQATDYLVFRDTGTANVASSTATLIFADETGADENTSAVFVTIMHKFPVPIRFTNGISANISASPTAVGRWTILYRPMDATE